MKKLERLTLIMVLVALGIMFVLMAVADLFLRIVEKVKSYFFY